MLDPSAADRLTLSRRHFLLSTSAALAGLALFNCVATAAPTANPSKPPNIVIILADDMGYADLSLHGCRDIPTPNIDSIAANGVHLTQAYVSAPVCSPTRAGLMCGRYQQRFGWEVNPNRGDPGISLKEKTIADYLKKAGYATGLVGKWHLGYEEPYLPLQRGFDEFFGFTYAMNPYLGNDKPNMLFRGNKQDVDEKEYLTDAFTREAIDYISRHKDHPFFLYLAYNAVHLPMDACPRYKDKFSEIADPKRRTLAAMLTAMDDGIGQVLKKLRDEGLEQNTLIFFFSDNGAPTNLNASSNAPFSGGKGSLQEGGIHTPMLIQWKNHLPAGKTFDQLAISLDVLPTALAAAGADLPADSKVEGVNLLPYLAGQKTDSPHDTLYWRMNKDSAIRRGNWKIRVTPALPNGFLVDLSKDPSEKTDLVSENPEKAKELLAAWNQWNQGNIPGNIPATRPGTRPSTQPQIPKND